MDFSILRSSISEIIDNQKVLQKYIQSNEESTLGLVEKYNTAIFVECGEAIQETDFKWWKATSVNTSRLKGELADVFLFAIDFAILLKQDLFIKTLLEETWKRTQLNDETNFKIMIQRLKMLGGEKFAKVYGERYGLFTMRAIIDLVVLYGYRDFIGVVIAKQEKNIIRQQNGYNRLNECATE